MSVFAGQLTSCRLRNGVFHKYPASQGRTFHNSCVPFSYRPPYKLTCDSNSSPLPSDQRRWPGCQHSNHTTRKSTSLAAVIELYRSPPPFVHFYIKLLFVDDTHTSTTLHSHLRPQNSFHLLEVLLPFLLSRLHTKDFNPKKIPIGGITQQRSHRNPPDSRASLSMSNCVSVSSSMRVPEFSTTWSA